MAEKKDEDVKQQAKGNELEEQKETEALKIVRTYMYWSMGAGLIPMPWLDVGVLAGVQLRMLHRLSEHYEVKFSENLVKSIIAALMGTITADSLRRGAFTSLIKSIPLIGFIGMVSMPIYAGATTYAIGKVFIQHFESGGTFLDFDAKKVKDHFAKLFEEGKLKASEAKAK